MKPRCIEVPILTRVEGEGGLHVSIEGNEIRDLRFSIFEPPRFFEIFLKGRLWREVTDIVARICGICPVAYQMSASQAIENAFGITVPPDIMALKRLYYCGEWIGSHALHIHMLAAPDIFGFPDVFTMAMHYPHEVRRGMRLQGLGNAIIATFGGRAVNPVGAVAGGFYRALTRKEAEGLLKRLHEALPEAEALVRWTAALRYPDVHRCAPWVSLRHPHEYPMVTGRIQSSSGLSIDAADFSKHYHEFQVPHSTALHSNLAGEPYWTGPLPRLNNNLDRLPTATRKLLEGAGIALPSDNPYHGTVARAVEIHIAVIEAIRILETYDSQSGPKVEVTPRAGSGSGVTEAPRGILRHFYTFDAAGYVTSAVITPPTSQNQAQIEADLRQSVLESLDTEDAELKMRLESAIRNYDPCISCATHLIHLTVERRRRVFTCSERIEGEAGQREISSEIENETRGETA